MGIPAHLRVYALPVQIGEDITMLPDPQSYSACDNSRRHGLGWNSFKTIHCFSI